MSNRKMQIAIYGFKALIYYLKRLLKDRTATKYYSEFDSIDKDAMKMQHE